MKITNFKAGIERIATESIARNREKKLKEKRDQLVSKALQPAYSHNPDRQVVYVHHKKRQRKLNGEDQFEKPSAQEQLEMNGHLAKNMSIDDIDEEDLHTEI